MPSRATPTTVGVTFEGEKDIYASSDCLTTTLFRSQNTTAEQCLLMD